MKLYYRQLGETETGTPLVILHGLFGSSDNWLTISKTMADHGHPVYLLDQRNHGRSPHSDVHDYDSMAADLMEFITDQDLKDPVVIGHSMGGKTVMQFAMNYPGQASRLVVIDIAPKFYPVHHAEILRGFNAINLATLKSRNEADAILREYESNLGVRQFLLKNLYRDEQDQFAWRLNLPIIEREIHGIGEDLRYVQTVTAPTLFVRGSESGYISDDDETIIKRIFPNVVFETIQGAGHWVQAEKPAEFLDVLFDFLEKPF